MAQLRSAPRDRDTVQLDGKRLLAEREAREFTQIEMAKYLEIGVSTYQKAEKGGCIDHAVGVKILEGLEADETDLGMLPCDPPPPQDTTAYLDFLQAENAFIDVRGLIVGSGKAPRLPIEKVYIPLQAAGGGQSKAKRSGLGELRSVPLEHTLKEHRKLVIVGDPGGGKSTFLKRLAFDQSGPNSTHFPVPIRIFALEDFIYKRVHGGTTDAPDADSADWIPRFLEDRAKEFQWRLDADFFRAKLREPSTLLLFDGLDEVPNSARREAIARLFERATKAYRDARFVVTTRPASYAGKSTLEGFETVSIGDLDRDAVTGFLDRWSGFLFNEDKDRARRHKEDLLGALAARPDIRRMARNPLMLTALAVIQWNERQLPEQRADLYESILHWLAKAHDYPNRPQGQTCLSLFGTLALEMQKYEGGRVKQIDKAEAARFIAPEFRDAPELRRVAAALEFLENEFVDSGIVASRGNSLEFWHLTFQEYLAARACADLDQPLELLLRGDLWAKYEWREVMLLFPGVLIRYGTKRVDAVLKGLMARAEASGSLALKARAAGLVGAALQDLRPLKYRLPDEERYHALLAEIMGIFDARRAEGIDLKVRVEAAEALGQAGDPRLKRNNWVKIPAGEFLIGAQKTRKNKPGYDEEAWDRELDPKVLPVAAFEIGRYPVTVQEFREFVEDEENGYGSPRHWLADEGKGYTGAAAPDEWDAQILHPNRPVTWVTWYAADAYCRWASERLGQNIHLPSEEQWEFAARGTASRKYPWGDQAPDPSRANYREANIGEPTPVGLFPAGNTPEPDGVADMGGNVWEWTRSDWDRKEGTKVVRGAAFSYVAWYLRASYRYWGVPFNRLSDIGFRCVRELLS